MTAPHTKEPLERLREKRVRYRASVCDLVEKTARARRMSEADLFRALVDQGLEASRSDWAGR